MLLRLTASGWLPSSRFGGPVTAATYTGHWACRVSSDRSAVKFGHLAELSQGRPSSVAPRRSMAALTGCELAVPTLSSLSANYRETVSQDFAYNCLHQGLPIVKFKSVNLKDKLYDDM